MHFFLLRERKKLTKTAKDSVSFRGWRDKSECIVFKAVSGVLGEGEIWAHVSANLGITTNVLQDKNL